MKPVADAISRRKKDHLRIALSAQAQIGNPGFDRYRLEHQALAEVNFDLIDTATNFLGKKIGFPLLISSMTGGIDRGALINRRLAVAAEKYHLPIGVGSQRTAVENPQLAKLFAIRQYAPTGTVLANVGLVQLNYGFSLVKLQTVINMVQADGLIFHLNPIQEAIQPEGDRNFKDLLPKLSRIINQIKVPVIIKEVGFGLSEPVIDRLYQAGVRIFDTAGWGGTNWAYVESQRSTAKYPPAVFNSWGIPTTESIAAAKRVKDKYQDKTMVIIASGGVRSGVDIAKAIALGADLAGIAAPLAQAALKSQSAVNRLIERLATELKISMFGTGVENISQLGSCRLATIT